MSAVIVDQLYKSYGKTRALNGVSFSVDEGELYGIIGPDGAGKSTLFRVLTTLMLRCGEGLPEDTRHHRIYAGKVLALSGFDGGGEFAVLRHGVQYHYRGKLPPDSGHLQANRAVQAPEGGQIVGRDEAEVGVELRVDT